MDNLWIICGQSVDNLLPSLLFQVQIWELSTKGTIKLYFIDQICLHIFLVKTSSCKSCFNSHDRQVWQGKIDRKPITSGANHSFLLHSFQYSLKPTPGLYGLNMSQSYMVYMVSSPTSIFQFAEFCQLKTTISMAIFQFAHSYPPVI